MRVTPQGRRRCPKINQDAVRLMKQLYGIDMEQTQYSKLLTELPPIDIVVTMGCNVNCPYLPCKYREDWGLDDPSGKDEAEYRKTITTIEQKMIALKNSSRKISNIKNSPPRHWGGLLYFYAAISGISSTKL